MLNLVKNKLYFIGEQDGEVERDFKLAIKNILHSKKIRAYLAQLKYDEKDKKFSIALCFRCREGEDNEVLHESTKIFKSIFGSGNFLDIIFINDAQEKDLRKFCCPFFTGVNYQVDSPDFYLISSEGYKLDNPISCFKRERLYGKHPDGYLLCDISPFFSGQDYDINIMHIKQLILANRHQNYSLFPIEVWPSYVHVAVPLIDLANRSLIDKSDLKLIAWGELYEHKQDILPPAG